MDWKAVCSLAGVEIRAAFSGLRNALLEVESSMKQTTPTIWRHISRFNSITYHIFIHSSISD